MGIDRWLNIIFSVVYIGWMVVLLRQNQMIKRLYNKHIETYNRLVEQNELIKDAFNKLIEVLKK